MYREPCRVVGCVAAAAALWTDTRFEPKLLLPVCSAHRLELVAGVRYQLTEEHRLHRSAPE